jgi:hypothetical protein
VLAAGVGGGFEVRDDARLGQPAHRALRLRVEFADGVDLVPEELDADGVVARERVHVEDPATERDLAGQFDELDGFEPLLDEPRHEGFRRLLVADAHGEGFLLHRLGRGDELGDGVHTRHDERRVAGLEALQHVGALDQRGALGHLLAVVRLLPGRGEDEYLAAFAEELFEVGLEVVSALGLGEEAAERDVSFREVGEREGGEGTDGAFEPEAVAGAEVSGLFAELLEERRGGDALDDRVEGHGERSGAMDDGGARRRARPVGLIGERRRQRSGPASAFRFPCRSRAPHAVSRETGAGPIPSFSLVIPSGAKWREVALRDL